MRPPLNLVELRQLGVQPHYFGLGFIQLKVSPTRRLHFWTPDWPTIPGAECEPHNHRYDFSSTIISGGIEQTLYQLSPARSLAEPGDMELIEVSCQPGAGQPIRVVGYVDASPLKTQVFQAGEQYTLRSTQFHVAKALGSAITQVDRGPVISDHALVLRAQGTIATCPFSIKKTEHECWDRIDWMLGE